MQSIRRVVIRARLLAPSAGIAQKRKCRSECQVRGAALVGLLKAVNFSLTERASSGHGEGRGKSPTAHTTRRRDTERIQVRLLTSLPAEDEACDLELTIFLLAIHAHRMRTEDCCSHSRCWQRRRPWTTSSFPMRCTRSSFLTVRLKKW